MVDGFGQALRIRLRFFIPSGCLSPTAKVIFRFSPDSLRKHILALKSWSSGPNPLYPTRKFSEPFRFFLYAFTCRISFLPHSQQ